MKNTEKPFAGKCLFFPRLRSAAHWNQTVQTGVLWTHLVWRDKYFEGSSEGQVGGEWLKQEVICEGRDRWSVQVFSCQGLGRELVNLRLLLRSCKDSNIADFFRLFFFLHYLEAVFLCVPYQMHESPFLQNHQVIKGMLLGSVGASHSSNMTFPGVGSNGCCLSAFFVLDLGVAVL